MHTTIEKIETGSTNDDAKALAQEGAAHLTVIWAHRQTAGRGGNDGKWVSIEGNVLWTIILRPQPNWPTVTDMVYVNALAVQKTLLDVLPAGADIQLKWPKDVLLNGGKLAGSLLESGGGLEGWTTELVPVV